MPHAWNLPELTRGRAADSDLTTRRTRVKPPPGLGDDELDVETRSVDIGGLVAYVIEPPRVVGTTVHLHGGGFRTGSAAAWCGFGGRLAVATSSRVIVPEYPLAPECPFPAALEALCRLYDRVVAEDDHVVLSGDSAGGNLVVALTVSCRDAGAPMPRGLILLSPWLDLTVTAQAYTTRGQTDRLFSDISAREAVELYLQGHFEASHPLASPMFADLRGLPPVLLFAGGDEVLLDDALHFGALLARAGVSVESHTVSGMQHEWPVLEPDLIESTRTLHDIARFAGRAFEHGVNTEMK
jgi:acetyl esterase/lipase